MVTQLSSAGPNEFQSTTWVGIAQSVQRLATGQRSGIESWWGRDFPHPSRPALGPTQPPIRWVPSLYRGVKWPRRGVDHPPHLAPRLKIEQSYTSAPPLGLHCLLQGELNFFLLPYITEVTVNIQLLSGRFQLILWFVVSDQVAARRVRIKSKPLKSHTAVHRNTYHVTNVKFEGAGGWGNSI